jgi:hypothetical protein
MHKKHSLRALNIKITTYYDQAINTKSTKLPYRIFAICSYDKRNKNNTAAELRGDQEGLFKLVTLDRILNRITGVTSGCWWLVIVNNIPISDICQINQQNISSCSVINNRIKKFS